MSAASWEARTSSSGPGARSSGSAATPSARWTASDALASNRLESRPSTDGPASRSGTFQAPASQAPSSIAVQSCADERHEQRSRFGLAADERRDVARSALQNRLKDRAAEELHWRVEEQQVAVELTRHPDRVVAGIRRREGRGARGDPVGEQPPTLLVQGGGRRRQAAAVVKQPRKHHLAGGLTCEWARER